MHQYPGLLCLLGLHTIHSCIFFCLFVCLPFGSPPLHQDQERYNRQGRQLLPTRTHPPAAAAASCPQSPDWLMVRGGEPLRGRLWNGELKKRQASPSLLHFAVYRSRTRKAGRSSAAPTRRWHGNGTLTSLWDAAAENKATGCHLFGCSHK